MDKAALEIAIATETQKLISARSLYLSAHQAHLDELERDCSRRDGSMAQEARREAHQADLREEERTAGMRLAALEAIVADLTRQYATLQN